MAKVFGINYNTKDEVIVEKMLWNGRFTAIAKVIIENRCEADVFSCEGLNDILKALNWRHTHISREPIPDGIYRGLWGIRRNGFAVVFMSDFDGCGSDIYLRKHYNLEFGVFYDVENGTWQNGKRETAVNTIKRNMNIRHEG